MEEEKIIRLDISEDMFKTLFSLFCYQRARMDFGLKSKIIWELLASEVLRSIPFERIKEVGIALDDIMLTTMNTITPPWEKTE